MTLIYKVWEERKHWEEVLRKGYAEKNGKMVRSALKRLQELKRYGF